MEPRNVTAKPAGKPLFGEVAVEAGLTSTDRLDECLEQQRKAGGRLGDILLSRGLICRDGIKKVLTLQASRIALALETDISRCPFPHPTFLSLCMPAYNEAENIDDTLDAACAILPEFVRQYEVVVVNDGSTDKTGEIVARYAQREPRVRILNHDKNQGYGAAVTTALRAARGEHVAFTDSDGQFSLLDLPHLIKRLHESDIVVGYRCNRADSWYRKLNAWGWNQLIRLLLGVHVRDLDCAFKIFPREVVEKLRLTSTGAGINAEILAQVVRSGLSIREIPVNHYPRYRGAPTGAALRVIAKAFRELPSLLKYRFDTPHRAKDKKTIHRPPFQMGVETTCRH